MELKELKDMNLSNVFMDAECISSGFVHKDGTCDVGNINLSGNYIGGNGTIVVGKTGIMPTGAIAINGTVKSNDSVAIGCKGGDMTYQAIADGTLCCDAGDESRGNAFAFGCMAKAIGYNTCAIGSGTAAGSHSFVAAGGSTYGSQSVALNKSTAKGTNSVSMNVATADGKGSVAMGNNASAFGDYSIAMGYMAKSYGDYSFSHGYGNSVSAIFGAAFGCSNDVMGNVKQKSKDDTLALFAEGKHNKIYGDCSHVGGFYSIVSGNVSLGYGYWSYVNGNNSIALGNYARMSSNNSFVFSGLKSANHQICNYGDGTFNLRLDDGLSGFYIHQTNGKSMNFVDCVVKALQDADSAQRENLKTSLKSILGI